MGLASIQASVQDVLAMLAVMADSDATPDSLDPDIEKAVELLTKVLNDAEETSDAVQQEGLNRLCEVVGRLKEELTGSLKSKLDRLRPEMAKVAQEIYDGWNQEDDGADIEFGTGGICDAVSQAIAGVIVSNIADVDTFDGGQDGDEHAWVVAQLGDEAYGVDIPPSVYETGGGYSWKKKRGAKFPPSVVEIFPMPLQEPTA